MATGRSMGWLILFMLIGGAAALFVRSAVQEGRIATKSSPRQPPRHVEPSPLPSLAVEEPRIRREVEAEVAQMKPEIEVEAARIQAEAMLVADAVAFDEDSSAPRAPSA